MGINDFLGTVGGFVWGPPLLILLVGTGIYLTIRLSFLQFTMLPYALKTAFTKKQDKKSEGDISHFQSLMTALAATIGTGNIAGVATAVVIGGPGAVFWMWISALVGMATKYAEAILAVKYRIKDSNGQMAGGPMYYIEKGLGWKWMAVLFAVFAAVASFGIGNTVQSNSVAAVLQENWAMPVWITGLILMVFTAFVILGGIKSIGRVVGFIVPFMALFYVSAGLIILILNLELIPGAVWLILSDAFTGQAAAGGAVGVAIQYGVARGVFSNEAGLGSAPIAAAAAKTDYPGRQALVSMTQVFIDTIVICSITGVTLVMGDMYLDGADGAALTSATFEFFLGPIGATIVAIGLIFFAYSTILGWSYYGERSVYYLFKTSRAIMIYRLLYVIAVFIGAVLQLDTVWALADIMNGLMAVPNLIALLLLSGVVVAETKIFLKKKREEERMVK
ncbi:AGCS family alanine or glycine:cation symporter [Sinobaca qinghaiensis]|uniref:AGCS family alanine or glycine:cation symporter n=1 Tax=Sinobaca qinghaiensis TaxID=342944 RepID=A0A419V6G8_9BACL|nr:sodium:alanine symporter family protein [Sinobaca qinghaiensis]RKD75560.1 AGCS family alanine or glycine:cation symporter [Sinobaca qinghaiensis]